MKTGKTFIKPAWQIIWCTSSAAANTRWHQHISPGYISHSSPLMYKRAALSYFQREMAVVWSAASRLLGLSSSWFSWWKIFTTVSVNKFNTIYICLSIFFSFSIISSHIEWLWSLTCAMLFKYWPFKLLITLMRYLAFLFLHCLLLIQPSVCTAPLYGPFRCLQ